MHLSECQKLREELVKIKGRRSKIRDHVLALRGGDLVNLVNVVNLVNSVKSVNSAHKLKEARELRLEVQELRLKVAELADEHLFVFKGKSEAGKDIVIDLRQERRESESFIHEHNLNLLADALPKRFRLSSETRIRIKEAIRQGFDRVSFMPGAAEQEKLPINTFKKELADTPLAGLAEEEQYTASYLEEPLSTECTMVENEKKQRQGAYLLFYSSGAVPDETKNLTFGKAEELFKKKGWNGLTLQELYLLERKECRKNKNHGWSAYDTDARKSNWAWCLASRLPAGHAGASGGRVSAGWSSDDRQVTVNWHNTAHSLENLGARPVVVVSL